MDSFFAADGPISLRARYLFPVASPPIADGVLTFHRSRIVAVGRQVPGAAYFDLGNVAILPGLVNAHVHLEFSDLTEPLGEPGMPLPQWIAAVVEHRRRRRAGGDAVTCESVARGLTESLAAGVTTLGEIATDPNALRGGAHDEAPVPCPSVAFLELLGLAAGQTESLVATAAAFLAAEHRPDGWLPGLSPHAPYTVHPGLVAEVCKLSARARVPVAMHLAESVEELELLGSHSGPFADLLRDLDAWDASAIPRGIRILDYLKMLTAADRALVIHGNYLSGPEVALLADHARSLSLVHCPRTHVFFGHADFPLADLLAAGVNVALGTDSRASSPTLSLLEDLRFVARRHPQVAPDAVVRLATLGAAQSLGLEKEVGSLAAGKRANLAIVGLPEDATRDPYELLLDSAEPVRHVVLGGQLFTAGS